MAEDVGEGLRIAAIARDPAALVSEFNKLLVYVPYEVYGEDALDERFYLGQMLTLLYAEGLAPYAGIQGDCAQPGVAFESGGQRWALGIKLNHNATGDAKLLAAEALKRVMGQNHGDLGDNPVFLGLVVNGQKRLIAAWKCLGGRASEPE
jgi:hypothetical protein